MREIGTIAIAIVLADAFMMTLRFVLHRIAERNSREPVAKPVALRTNAGDAKAFREAYGSDSESTYYPSRH